MSETKKTVQQVFSELTGYDEAAIAKTFDAPISILMGGGAKSGNPTLAMRALAFVLLRRDGSHDAKSDVMKMTIREVADLFADEPGEVSEDAAIGDDAVGEAD